MQEELTITELTSSITENENGGVKLCILFLALMGLVAEGLFFYYCLGENKSGPLVKGSFFSKTKTNDEEQPGEDKTS